MRLTGTQSTTGEDQKTNTNTSVANDATRLKLKGCLVAHMHVSERTVQSCTTHLEHGM